MRENSIKKGKNPLRQDLPILQLTRKFVALKKLIKNSKNERV